MGDLIGFGFEIGLIGKGENEVQNAQAGLDQLVGMTAPVARTWR